LTQTILHVVLNPSKQTPPFYKGEFYFDSRELFNI
jgi:hypothetical protein